MYPKPTRSRHWLSKHSIPNDIESFSLKNYTTYGELNRNVLQTWQREIERMEELGEIDGPGGLQLGILTELAERLSPYDPADLLASVAALQLLPENADRTVRLEAFAHTIASLPDEPDKPHISLSL